MPLSLKNTPGGLASKHEIRRAILMLGGQAFETLLPDSHHEAVFEWFTDRWRDKFHARRNHDPIVARMRRVLGASLTDAEILAGATQFHNWRMEDLWSRWRLGQHNALPIRTEVVGLEHVENANALGKGVIFWGMTCCGTLFPKIALSEADCTVTQLSTADHGCWYPLTMLGKYVAGPIHCRPENRYIRERIRIPLDGNSAYLQRIGEVLRERGSVWMAGERTRAKKLVAAKFLNRDGQIPVGAPVLALRNRAPLLPVTTQRLGRLHYRVSIMPPVPLERGTNRRQLIADAVQVYADNLSARILESPGDWDWNHLWVQDFAAGE